MIYEVFSSLSIITKSIYLERSQLFDFPQIGGNKQEAECESLSQHDRAPPPFFGHEVRNASTSGLLIGALQEAELCRVPDKFQTSHHWILLWVIYGGNIFCADNIWGFRCPQVIINISMAVVARNAWTNTANDWIKLRYLRATTEYFWSICEKWVIWNANLMQQVNFIDVFLARHVSGTYAHHQEH